MMKQRYRHGTDTGLKNNKKQRLITAKMAELRKLSLSKILRVIMAPEQQKQTYTYSAILVRKKT